MCQGCGGQGWESHKRWFLGVRLLVDSPGSVCCPRRSGAVDSFASLSVRNLAVLTQTVRPDFYYQLFWFTVTSNKKNKTEF